MVSLFKLLLMMATISQNTVGYTSNVDYTTPSIAYVEGLGVGWNLGNSFDSYEIDADSGETTWDNPKVTQELIQAIKAEGFQSIRIPLTLFYRMDSEYVIDQEYLDRYQEVVDWALDEDLYVIINVHHDSKEWLSQWDGQKSSEEYQRFTAIWEQLAERFRNYDKQLSFESINEPYFDAEEPQQIRQLALLNQAFHQIVRQSGGQNNNRMLILQTLLAQDNQVYLDALLKEIRALQDPNIIASTHYYGEWEFSNNMGITMIDEPFRQGKSQRQLNEEMVNRLKQTFVNNGIGVIIGEYGLLGFDRHPQANNLGETYKFIEDMNNLTRNQPISLILWDNGQHFNRESFNWEPAQFGDIVVQSIYGHSAYGTYIDQFFIENIEDDLFINLTYNGLVVDSVLFNGSRLVEEKDFEANQDGLYIQKNFFEGFVDSDFINGVVGTFTIRFDQGATWNQDVFLVGDMIFESISDQELDQDILIPVEYGGHQVKRISLKNNQGFVKHPDSALPYLTFLEDFTPDYENQVLELSQMYFSQLEEGYYELVIETFDEQSYSYELWIENGIVQGQWQQ